MEYLSFWCLFIVVFTMNNLVQESSRYSPQSVVSTPNTITNYNHRVYPCRTLFVELPHRTIATYCLPTVPLRLLLFIHETPHRMVNQSTKFVLYWNLGETLTVSHRCHITLISIFPRVTIVAKMFYRVFQCYTKTPSNRLDLLLSPGDHSGSPKGYWQDLHYHQEVSNVTLKSDHHRIVGKSYAKTPSNRPELSLSP